MAKITIQKTISFHFLLLENETKLVFVDPNVYPMLGYKANDFIEENIQLADLFHSDDQDILCDLFSLVSQNSVNIHRQLKR